MTLFFLAILLAGFGEADSPAVTVNGSPVLLSQPTTRVGAEWFVQVLPIAKALMVDVRFSAASPLLTTRRSDGTEITYDFRTGEIRNGYVLIGSVKRHQDIKPSASPETLLFPVSGIVALFGVDVSEDEQRNILNFSSNSFSAKLPSNAGTFNLSSIDYRYGLTTNGHKFAQFVELNGEGLIGGVHTTGKALLSRQPDRAGNSINQASVRAEWMDGKVLTLGNRSIYTGIDAHNAAVLAGVFERGIGKFRASTFLGRAVGMTPAGGDGMTRPAYDTTIAGISLLRTVRGGEVAIGGNVFHGANRNGNTIGLAYTAAPSDRHQFKAQLLFGNFKGSTSVNGDHRRVPVTGLGAGFSVADTFTPIRQLTLSGQYEVYGKNVLTVSDDSRFNGQSARSVSATLRPLGFITLNGGITERRSAFVSGGPARTYTYGANVSAPLGAQLGVFRSILNDPASPQSQFVMTQYSIGLPSAGRFGGNVMISELDFQGKKVRSIGTFMSISQTRFGQIGFRDQVQFGNNHRVGMELSRDLRGAGSLRIGIDRIFARSGAGGFAPTATLQLPLRRGRSLQISYIGDRKTHMFQLEFGGRLRDNRELELDSRGAPRIVADAPLTGRIYVDANADGRFDKTDDRPLSGVTVWLDKSTSATTDGQGFYRFDAVEPGAHHIYSDIAAVPADLTFAESGERLVSVAPYRVNTQDLRLVKTGRVTGKVVYMDYSDIDNPIERPLPDARIIAGEHFDTFSEVDGQFLLGDLPPGEYSFRIDGATIPPNYASKQGSIPLTLKAGETVSGLLFQIVVPPKPVIMLN